MTEPQDLERRLEEGLHGVAGRSPHPGDLVAGARSRLRRRRRTTAAVVATTLAVVAVPVVLTLGGRAGEPDRQEPSVVDSVPSGWRVESFRDLTLRVPPRWTWGSGTDWCADGRDLHDPAQVSRPGRVVRTIGCTPSYGYGVHFEEPSSGELPPGTEGTVQQYSGTRYPDGAWLGYVSTGQAAVWVVTDQRTLTRQVLDTVEPIRDFDANGCPIPEGGGLPNATETASICWYGPDGLLEQSQRLTRDETGELWRVLLEAPASPATEKDCRPRSVEGVLVFIKGWTVPVVYGSPCPAANGVTFRGKPVELTQELLPWVLPPGWAGSMLTYAPPPNPGREE